MRKVLVAALVCAVLVVEPAGAQAESCSGLLDCNSTDVTVSAGAESFDTEIFVATGGGKARPLGGASGSCPGCTYVLLPSCPQNTVTGGGEGPLRVEDGVLCGGAVYPCPDERDTRFYVFRRRPGEAYERVDVVCLGPGSRPVSRGAIEAAAARYLGSLRPAPAGVHVQPPGGTIVNVETVFHADGQPAVSGTVDPGQTAGIAVTVTAAPASWEWIFEGDADAAVRVTEPGGPYPDHAVAHRYRRPNERETVTLVTTWTGSYAIRGVTGEQPVPGPGVRVTSRTAFRVYETRAELVAGA